MKGEAALVELWLDTMPRGKVVHHGFQRDTSTCETGLPPTTSGSLETRCSRLSGIVILGSFSTTLWAPNSMRGTPLKSNGKLGSALCPSESTAEPDPARERSRR